jgi:ATP-dependent DNA ligase
MGCPAAGSLGGRGRRGHDDALVGLTAAKMKDCRWLRPVLVGQFEFLEWTGDNHLRHSKFIALREDKNARDVKRE